MKTWYLNKLSNYEDYNFLSNTIMEGTDKQALEQEAYRLEDKESFNSDPYCSPAFYYLVQGTPIYAGVYLEDTSANDRNYTIYHAEKFGKAYKDLTELECEIVTFIEKVLLDTFDFPFEIGQQVIDRMEEINDCSQDVNSRSFYKCVDELIELYGNFLWKYKSLTKD